MLHEHHLTVERTARYYTIEPGEEGAREVWVACHGYSQLAERFLRQLAALDDGRRLVVAPEALSRYYLHVGEPAERAASGADGARTDASRADAPLSDPGRAEPSRAEAIRTGATRPSGGHALGGRVGATWMTREDRLSEIADYVAYLDALARHVFRRVERSAVSLHALGFSQGGATATRWAAQGTTSVDELILWGSHLPPDLDLSAAPRLASTRVRFVWGEKDPYYDPARVAEDQARLAGAGIESRVTTYPGGHRISRGVLAGIAGSREPRA
jgi:predicted esterase